MRTPELLSLFDQYMRMYANCKKNGGRERGEGVKRKKIKKRNKELVRKRKNIFVVTTWSI